MGFGKTKRQVRLELEVYNVEGIEFKMVRIPGKSYAIAQTQVTQALYRAVTGKSPSNFTGDQLPVEKVSWEDGIVFCNELSKESTSLLVSKGIKYSCVNEISALN